MKKARSAHKILSVSRNERVLATRNMVLEAQGWQVATTMDDNAALGLLRRQAFAAVVLGDSIPAAERLALAQAMKALKPGVPIVMLYRTGDGTNYSKSAEHFVNSLDNPSTLIGCVRQCLEKAQEHNGTEG